MAGPRDDVAHLGGEERVFTRILTQKLRWGVYQIQTDRSIMPGGFGGASRGGAAGRCVNRWCCEENGAAALQDGTTRSSLRQPCGCLVYQMGGWSITWRAAAVRPQRHDLLAGVQAAKPDNVTMQNGGTNTASSYTAISESPCDR